MGRFDGMWEARLRLAKYPETPQGLEQVLRKVQVLEAEVQRLKALDDQSSRIRQLEREAESSQRRESLLEKSIDQLNRENLGLQKEVERLKTVEAKLEASQISYQKLKNSSDAHFLLERERGLEVIEHLVKLSEGISKLK